MDIFQIYLAILFGIYFGLLIGVRTVLLYMKSNINAIKEFGTNPKVKQAENRIQFALLILMITGLIFICFKSYYSLLLPFEFLEYPCIRTSGFYIGVFGLLTSFIAQLQMEDSWRLGIDETAEIKLVTKGLFKYSRNPIYTALGIGFIGFFLVAPNLGSLIFLILMANSINQKILDEESFLERKLGKDYIQYKQSVRRWL